MTGRAQATELVRDKGSLESINCGPQVSALRELRHKLLQVAADFDYVVSGGSDSERLNLLRLPKTSSRSTSHRINL